MKQLLVLTLVGAAALLGQETFPETAPPRAARLIYSTFAPGGRVDRPSRVAPAPDGSLYISSDDAEPPSPFVSATPPFAAVSRVAPDGEEFLWTRVIAGTEYSAGLAADADGNAYIVGRAADGFEPTPGALDQGGEGFVVKLNPEGEVVYAARLAAEPRDAAVDAAGRAVVVGRADESFQPAAGALKPVIGPANCGRRGSDFFPCPDAFVLVLSQDGSTAEWSTFLGGDRTDFAVAVALDSAGDIHVAGETLSENFPTTAGAPQREFGGAVMFGPFEFGDGFAAKLRADGGELLHATYLGGAGADFAADIVVAAAGEAVVVGGTQSLDFPVTPGARPPVFGGGGGSPGRDGDVFIAWLDGDGAGVRITAVGGPGPAPGAPASRPRG